MARKRLKQHTPVILGVAAVVARELQVSPLVVRIVMLLLLISSFGLMMLGYFGLWAYFNSQGMLQGADNYSSRDIDDMEYSLEKLDRRLDRLEEWVSKNDIRLRKQFRN